MIGLSGIPLFAPAAALAADPPKKPAVGAAKPAAAPAKPAVAGSVRAGFTAKDLRTALGRDRALLAVGAKPLPAAVRKALVRGKPIPPAAAAQAVPSHLQQQLPIFKGYGWMRAGTDLLLVATATRQVADIVPDTFD
jgi:hypothetical protein